MIMPFIRKSIEIGAAALLVVWLSACSDAPGEARVTQIVEGRLISAFEPGTLSLTSLRRLGSGPLKSTADGRAQRIVYYNAVLTFEHDFDFSAWDTLNVAAFANLLGATKQGVSGLVQGGNHQGDQILVHGTASFVQDEQEWTPIAFVQPGVGTPSPEYNTGPPTESQQLIERISSLFQRETAKPEQQREIIKQELDQVYSSISIRLDRLDRAMLVAGGPPDGEYIRIAQLLAASLSTQGVSANAVRSTGSADNIRLLSEGRADLALVQNDLAELAQLGEGPFEQSEPYYDLRALASLFPEPLHIVVARDSTIEDVRDLIGKRVEIGQPNSGSRASSLMLLNAGGIALDRLQAIHETGLERGLAMLSEGRVDAVLATISAPARQLQRAAANNRVRFLSLPPDIQQALIAEHPDFVPIRLPASTYPNQAGGTDTVAVTALLVASAGLPEHEVERVLETLFDRIDFLGAGSAAGSLIARATAEVGVTIPMHPAALRFVEPVEQQEIGSDTNGNKISPSL